MNTDSSGENASGKEEDNLNMDLSIWRKAAENNLSKSNIKDIIKSVVSNDQVLAICKLRAEEIERHKQENKKQFTNNLLLDTPDGTKLTRNKAK